MSQPPQQVNMAGMGGPVGGPQQQQMNAGTPNSGGGGGATMDYVKRLNTAIYDYLLRNQLYDTARSFQAKMEIETDTKKSPNQRQGPQQPNGVDDSMDIDDSGIRNRPDDLPAPLQLGDGQFLHDWWCQFWEIYQGHRGKGKQSTMNYIGAQRQSQKARTSMMGAGMDPQAMQGMRGYNGVMQMNNGMMPNDLKRQAMQNPRNMTPQQLQQMKNMQAANNNPQMMQGQQMERQGSQMDTSGPRSGSPGSGDAPSPKRQRLDNNNNNIQQMNQGRPAGPQHMQSNQVGGSPFPSDPNLPYATPPQTQTHGADPAQLAQTQELLRAKGLDPNQIPPQQLHNLACQPANYQAKSVEAYSSSIKQSMQAAMNQHNNSNMNPKGMPQNPATAMNPAAAAAAAQQGMDSTEFYAAANGGRMPVMANGPQAAAAAAAAAAQQGGNGNGNHALQDYQMQLMLLEQQNKKRLLMARQEQDSMAHPGPNGQFAPAMSPQGSRAGDPSPNPNDMHGGRGTPKIGKAGMSPNGAEMAGRGSPQPGMMNPNMNMVPPELRQQMVMQNGQMMRPPSSHPMGQQMTPEQMAMFRQQQAAGGMPQGMPNGMPNGMWQHQQGPPGQQPQQMMPGQPGPQGIPQQQQQPGGPQQQQPGPPNMTPRQGNQPMPPPPPPTNVQNGTQPSSPAPTAQAPPTPSQSAKGKGGGKKEAGKKGAKKGGAGATGATPVSESEAPPTPTPATPLTPMHPNSFAHQHIKNLPNGQQAPGGPPQQNGPPQQQQPQPPQQQPQQPLPQQQQPQDIGPFGNIDTDQFSGMNMDFANLDGTDVLDTFDFEQFLNTNGDDSMAGFDANIAFGDGGFGLEAGGDMGNP